MTQTYAVLADAGRATDQEDAAAFELAFELLLLWIADTDARGNFAEYVDGAVPDMWTQDETGHGTKE